MVAKKIKGISKISTRQNIPLMLNEIAPPLRAIFSSMSGFTFSGPNIRRAITPIEIYMKVSMRID